MTDQYPLINERYRLEAEVGRGGLGVIYRAYDSLLDRPVAVKVLTNPGLGAEGRARLLREARSAARLSHPNIVTIYDAGETDDLPGSMNLPAAPAADAQLAIPDSQFVTPTLPFIVMEFVEGESLFSQRPPGLEAMLRIIRQVCKALDHAHTNGIVHRDLKPENILITPAGQVKLTDFGLARSLRRESGNARLTQEGAITGTLLYMPPEQALGQTIDGRTDLYALGVVLYELVAGRLPFTADDPLALVSQHLYAPVVPPSTHRPGLAPALDALILKLLSKQPDDRPASAAEVIRVLDSLLQPERVTASHSPLDLALDVSPLEQLAGGRLVGRERELAEARRQWRQVLESQVEEPVLLVSGEAGVGKTPFVQELRALARVTGARVLDADCYMDGTAPYAPIAQLIRSALPLALSEAGRSVGRDSAQTPLFASAAPGDPLSPPLPQAVLNDLLTLAPEMQPYLAPLAGAFQTAAAPGMHNLPMESSAGDAARLYESFVALCTLLAHSAPLMLVVEDVHWSDPGSLAVLRHLARRSRSAHLRLWIVLTYRDDQPADNRVLTDVILDLARERLVHRIRLGRFDLATTRQLLNSMLQEEVGEEFASAIYRRTEGNQFFIEELLKALVEQGLLYREGASWCCSDLERVQLPESIHMVIHARLEQLTPEAQDVLRLAAIIGYEFDFETLRRASDLEEDALVDALETAEKAQFIREQRSPGAGAFPGPVRGLNFTFVHGLMQTVLYQDLSSLRRRRMHRRVAAALEAGNPAENYDALAHHYRKAGDSGQAQRYYFLAGDRSLGMYANQCAEEHFRHALEMEPESPDRASLLLHLGEALMRQGRYAAAREHWGEALELYQAAGNVDNKVALLYARLARVAWHEGHPARGLELCRAGLQAARASVAPGAGSGEAPLPETRGVAFLLQEMARACHFNDLPEEALAYCQQAMDLAGRLNLVEVQAETLATLGILPNQPASAKRQALLQAIELSESAGLIGTAARAHLNLGVHLQELGQLQDALVHFQQARDMSRRAGLIAKEFGHLRDVTETLFELGDLNAMQPALNDLQALLDALPDPDFGQVTLHVLRALWHRGRGELQDAFTLAQTARSQYQPGWERRTLMMALLAQAEAALDLQRWEEARAALREAITVGEPDATGDYMIAQCLMCELHLAHGKLDQARSALNAARGCEDALRALLCEERLRLTEARFARAEGRWEDALAAYADVAEMAQQTSGRWRQAQAELEWGQALQDRGQVEDQAAARQHLETAHALFEQCGAVMYVAALEAVLGK